MSLSRTKLEEYHREVVDALKVMGNPTYGKAIQQDRGSRLEHLGIRFPDLRRRVRIGFSFYQLSEDQVLDVWDHLWQASPYGDVLFAALEYFAPIVRRQVSPNLWPVTRHWSHRVDNWCHSDGLSAIYSWILETQVAQVYPQIVCWNQSESEWLRRISLVSLIHYSGKHATFLLPEQVLPLVSSCIDDRRYHVQMAVGWVLREMGHVYGAEITHYLEGHADRMGTQAFSRAIERMLPEERARLRNLRKARLA